MWRRHRGDFVEEVAIRLTYLEWTIPDTNTSWMWLFSDPLYTVNLIERVIHSLLLAWPISCSFKWITMPSLCKLSSCTMEGREFPHEHLIVTPTLKTHQNNLYEKLVCYIKWKQNSMWLVWILPGPRKPHCKEFFLSHHHNVTCGLWAPGFNNEALVRHHRARGKQAVCDYSSCSDQKTHSGPTALWKLLKHLGWERTIEWKGGRILQGKL